MRLQYIAIEGVIGVGKTSLTNKLVDHFGGRIILEQHEENPFLKYFYNNPRQFAFPVQLFFLLSRYRQQQEKKLDSLKLEGDEKIGGEIVRRALEEPLRQIANNAGHEGSIVVQKVKENTDVNFGFNAETEEYGDMLKAGVVDPTKVTRVALENAGSVSGLLLMTETTIVEKPEAEKPMPPMPPGGGGMY